MNYEDLTPEQQAKAKECETLEDVLAFAKSEFIELDEEQIESIAAGGWGKSSEKKACPECESTALEKDRGGWECLDCGYTWG